MLSSAAGCWSILPGHSITVCDITCDVAKLVKVLLATLPTYLINNLSTYAPQNEWCDKTSFFLDNFDYHPYLTPSGNFWHAQVDRIKSIIRV